MVDGVEARLDVRIEHPHPALVTGHPDGLQGLLGRTLRAEPEADRTKSASKIGSSTIFAAAITIRSPTVGIPNGLV